MQVSTRGQAVAEEPLAVGTAGTMISGVAVTAMRTVTRGGMIEWIGGAAARGMTITGMTAGGMTEVGPTLFRSIKKGELSLCCCCNPGVSNSCRHSVLT